LNWDAVQAVAELIAAAAVILSLGYVALQVRQNTDSVQASTVARSSEVMNRLRSSVWTDPEAARIYSLALAGDPVEDPSDSTRTRMFFAAIGRDYEAVYFQHRSGQLPDDIWEGWRREIMLIFGTPGGRDAVEGLREGFLSPDFYTFLRQELDALPEESPIAVLRACWDKERDRRLSEGSREGGPGAI